MEGWQSTDLTSTGQGQALALGQRLAAEGWEPTHIYCSPLQRATATLQGMLAGFGADPQLPPMPLATEVVFPQGRVPVTLRDDLKEYNQGIFNGLTWAEAQALAPELCQRLETSLDWQPIPEAETLAQGHGRAKGFITEVLSHHDNGDRLWVISHHWWLQQAIASLLGSDRPWGFAIGHTACFEFWLDRDRWDQTGPNRLNTELWQIKRWNDRGHWA
jgi:broad specificity phosphatase PhoE